MNRTTPPMPSIDLSDYHLDQSISAWSIAFAVLTLIATWILGRLTRRAVLELLARVPGVTEDLRRLAGRIAKYFVWVVGAGVAASFLGAQLQPLLAAVLIVAAVGALAFRGIAENFGAGLIIQTRRPIQIGDWVESQGYVGSVRSINGRSVILETADGQTVHLPNAEVLREPLVNDSAEGRRRSDLEVRVAVGVERVDEVHELIAAALASCESVDDAISPSVLTTTIEARRTTILVRVWHAPDASMSARSEAMHAIARQLGEAKIGASVQAPPPPPTAPTHP